MAESTEMTFDLPAYLAGIGLPKYFKPSPNVETLYMIVNKHVLNLFYQNIEFHDKDLKYKELSLKNITDSLLVKKEGGNCFKMTELLYTALENIGFEAYRIFGQVLDGEPYDPKNNKPAFHFFIIVKLDQRMFLIDCGFSANSLRYPLEFIPEKTQEIEINPFEKYKLEFNTDHYILYLSIKGEWISLVSFSHPLVPALHEEIEARYKLLIESPEPVGVRDSVVNFGKLNEDGRVGVSWRKKVEGFEAFSFVHVNGQIFKNKLENYDEFANDVKKYFGYEVPPLSSLKKYEKPNA